MRKDEILFRNLAQSITSEDIVKVRQLNQEIKLTELYRRTDVPLHKTCMEVIKDSMCSLSEKSKNSLFFSTFIKELPDFWFNKYLKNMIEVVIKENKYEKYDQIKNNMSEAVFYKNHNFTNASFYFYSHNDYPRFHNMMSSSFLNTKDNYTVRKAIFKMAYDKDFKEKYRFVEDIFVKASPSWIHGTCRNVLAYKMINQPQSVLDTFFYFNDYFGKDIVQNEIINALGEKYETNFNNMLNNYELNLKLNNTLKDTSQVSKQKKI